MTQSQKEDYNTPSAKGLFNWMIDLKKKNILSGFEHPPPE